jgi:hypothetical protein
VSEAIDVDPPVTIAEFDAFLEAQQDDALWELVAGRIVAMTNPTEDHEQIAGNMGAHKGLPTLRHNVLVYQGQIRVEHYRRTDKAGRRRH